VTVSKVYFARDGQIQVHQSRVKSCPPHFPHGFYWYGNKRRGPGRPPKWVAQILDEQTEILEESEVVPENSEIPEESAASEESSDQDNEPEQATPTINCHYPLRNRSGRA